MIPDKEPLNRYMIVRHDEGLLYQVEDVRRSTTDYEKTHALGDMTVNYIQLEDGAYPAGTTWNKDEAGFRTYFTKEAPVKKIDTSQDRVARSPKSRTEKPAIYPERFVVPEDKAYWSVDWPDYDPPYFVADSVIANDVTRNPKGWADPEDLGKLKRTITSYEEDIFTPSDGYPCNPYTRTGIRGRGLLGKWGPNFAADPIISRINPETGVFEVVMITRADNGEKAIPGGMVDEGEDVSLTIEREFREEAGVSLDMSQARLIYRGYVDDPRNTDNAWMETTAKHLHLDNQLASRITLEAGDDAAAVQWLPINTNTLSTLYASHSVLITKAIELFLADDQLVLTELLRSELSSLTVAK